MGAQKSRPALHERLFSDLHLHIVIVDPAGRVAYANPLAETALAARPGELKSVMLDCLLSLRNPQWLSYEIRRTAVQGRWAGEVVLNRRDNSECWVHVQAFKCPVAFGLGDSIIIEFEDITGNIELMTTLMKRNEDLFQRNRELEIVNKVGKLLLADTDLEYRLTAMLKEATRTLGIGGGFVWVKSRDGQSLVLRSCYGYGTNLVIDALTIDLNGDSLAALTVRTGKSYTSQDVLHDPRAMTSLLQRFDMKSCLSVPMMANDDVLGVLFLAERERRRTFSQEEITLAEVVANSAASALSNALLAEDADVSRAYWQRTFDSMSQMMLVVDPDCKVLRANQALAAQLGTTTSALLGESYERMLVGLRRTLLQEVILRAQPANCQGVIAGQPCDLFAFPLRHPSGKVDAVAICATPSAMWRRRVA